VQIGERPQNIDEKVQASLSVSNWRGLEVQDLGLEIARRFRIEEKTGVVVVNVEANSPADRAGIIPGDVIIEINKKDINNLSSYESIISNLKGDALVRTSRGYFLVKSE